MWYSHNKKRYGMKTAQVYFEDNIFKQLQKEAQKRNITISELIQELVPTSIKKKSAFDKMVGIWKDKNIDIEEIRKKAWRWFYTNEIFKGNENIASKLSSINDYFTISSITQMELFIKHSIKER